MNFTRQRFVIYEDCAEVGSPTAMHNRAFHGSPHRDPPPPISRRGYGLFANVPFEPERTPTPPRPRRRRRKEKIPDAFLMPPPRDEFPCCPTPTHREEDEGWSDECGNQEPALRPEEQSMPCGDESAEETQQPVESPRRRLKLVKKTTKKWTCGDKTTEKTTQTKIFEGQTCESQIPEGQMPEDQMPECQIPEEQISECHMPQSRIPQSQLPQSRIPRSRLPQRQLPQSQIPECRMHQSRQPQSRLPQSRLPQSRIPQRQVPQSQIPECQMPQSRLHQSHLPRSRLPQSRLPQSRLPQSRLPQSRVPQFEIPEDPTTECQMPQSRMPQSRLPQSRLPRYRLPQSQMPQGEIPQCQVTQSRVRKRGGPEGCQIRFMRNYFEYSSEPESEKPFSPAQRLPQLPCEPHQAIAAQPSYDLRNAEDFLQECSPCSTDPEDDAIGGDVIDHVEKNLEEMRSRLRQLRQTPPTFQLEEASVTYPASGGGSCTPSCPKQHLPLPPPKSSQRCPPRPESSAYSPRAREDEYRFPSSPEYRRMVSRRQQAHGRTSPRPRRACARNLFGTSPDQSQDDL
ncbi:involucrin-like [Ischnura elegans]|uniref:involucrin-like n=1 Tax=Ischnura elegans TaxID=197161 RepID=UPI001ED87256|nr:involucrin-like [Ischnura elegans]